MAQSRKSILNQTTKYDFHIKKSLGQNFLSDSQAARKIAVVSRLSKNTTVIEVGPGTGALTDHLLELSKKVIAFEIDHDVIPILKENTEGIGELEVIEGDILEQNLDFINDIEGEVVAVSNLPYYITSPIIDLFLNKVPKIQRMYFMVQKEVADRITASISTKDYNAFSILVQYKANIKNVMNVKRTCFTPEPNVDSAVLEFVKVDREYKANSYEFFKKVVETSFRERRKTILNNLSLFKSKDEMKEILEELGINPALRPENLLIDDYIKLSNYLGDE